MGTNRIAVEKFAQLWMVRRTWLPEAKQNQRRSVCVCGSLGWALWTLNTEGWVVQISTQTWRVYWVHPRPEKAAARRRRTRESRTNWAIDNLVLTAGKMWMPLDPLPDDAFQQFWFLEISQVRADIPWGLYCIAREALEERVDTKIKWWSLSICQDRCLHPFVYIWYILTLARKRQKPQQSQARCWNGFESLFWWRPN